MKIWIALMLYILSSFFGVSAKINKIDTIVAIVNNQSILESDINKLVCLFKHQKKENSIPIDINILRKSALHKAIIDRIMLEEANFLGIQITDKQINNIIQNIAIEKNMTLEQLKNSFLKNKHYECTYYDYLKKIKEEITIQILQNYELSRRIHINKKDVDILFKKLVQNNNRHNKIRFSYIFLPLEKNNSKKKYNKNALIVQNMQKKINNRSSFLSISSECMKYKNCFVVNNTPWINFNTIQKRFFNPLNITKKGEVIGPFVSKKGLYILKINDILNKKSKIVNYFYIQDIFVKHSSMSMLQSAKNHIFQIYKNIENKLYSFNFIFDKLSKNINIYNKNTEEGWISDNFLEYNLNRLLMNLSVNENSYPIRSNVGWHIIKVLRKHNIDQYYMIEKQKAYQMLLQYQIILARIAWLNELQKSSYVHIIKT